MAAPRCGAPGSGPSIAAVLRRFLPAFTGPHSPQVLRRLARCHTGHMGWIWLLARPRQRPSRMDQLSALSGPGPDLRRSSGRRRTLYPPPARRPSPAPPGRRTPADLRQLITHGLRTPHLDSAPPSVDATPSDAAHPRGHDSPFSRWDRYPRGFPLPILSPERLIPPGGHTVSLRFSSVRAPPVHPPEVVLLYRRGLLRGSVQPAK